MTTSNLDRTAILNILARDAGGCAARTGVAAAVGEELHRELGALGVELVLPASGGAQGDAQGGGEAAASTGGKAWSAIAWWPGATPEEVATSAPIAPPQGRPKMRLLRGNWEVRVPVPMADGTAGHLSVGFPGDQAPDMALETAFLLSVGCLVGVACSGCDRGAQALQRVAELEQENVELRARAQQLGGERAIVAVSRAMREVVEALELVAPHATAVLLQAEAGTSTELLARHLHACSPRKAAAFESVRCATVPEAVIESELFGHEPGAFAGATARHVGKLERAHGGTLLLDDVEALPLAVQVKLLRVMQDGVIERVGGCESIACDVRVVASTVEALEERVEQSAFRADLFYALNAFPIRVPALRERPEDIAELARTKLREQSARLGRDGLKLSREQLRELCAAPWHGNERALESYLERAMILSTGKALTLPPMPTGPASPRGARGAESAQALSDSIREAIAAALETTNGKLYGADGAAALLGLKPSTLQSKMAKLGIQRASFER